MIRTLTPLLALLLLTPILAAAPDAETLSGRIRLVVDVTLDLNEQQQRDLDVLLDTMERARTEIESQYEHEVQTLHDKGDMDVERYVKLRNAIDERLAAARDRAVADIALLLTEEQRPRHDALARRIQRLNEFGISGAIFGVLGADPIIISAELGLPDALGDEARADFENAMHRYDLAIPRHARRAERSHDELWAYINEMGIIIDGDPALLDRFDDILDDERRLRDVVSSRLNVIRRTLPEPEQKEWIRVQRRLTYPTVYATHWAERTLELVLAAEGLYIEERERLRAVEEIALGELQAYRDEARDAIDEAESTLTAAGVFEIFDAEGEGEPPASIELSKRIRSRLLDALDPHHHALVPPLPDAARAAEHDD